GAAARTTARPRLHERRHPRGGARSERPRAPARDRVRARAGRARRRRGGVRERARYGNPPQRSHRDRGAQARPRPAGRRRSGELDQGRHGPHHGRGRDAGSDHVPARRAPRGDPPHPRLRERRRRVRSRLRAAASAFRASTRECLLGVAAVQATLDDAGISREAIAGTHTALLYVTAASYGSSNRAFIAAGEPGSAGALHFPYTAPSAVPAEVTIEYGLRGTYVTLIGGATVTLEALAWAGRLLAEGACERALVLAVETFAECADLFARDRRLLSR